MNIAPYSPAKYQGVWQNISLSINTLAATAVCDEAVGKGKREKATEHLDEINNSLITEITTHTKPPGH